MTAALDRDARTRTALHEAAHAVVAVVLDLPLASVTIYTEPRWAGYGWLSGAVVIPDGGSAFDRATAILAGAAVERRVYGRARGTALDDAWVAYLFDPDGTVAPAQRAALIAEAEARADQLVAYFITPITRVAGKLLARGELDGQTVREMLEPYRE